MWRSAKPLCVRSSAVGGLEGRNSSASRRSPICSSSCSYAAPSAASATASSSIASATVSSRSCRASAVTYAMLSSLMRFDFDVLTFDCYGTLIDWEAGLVAGIPARCSPRTASAPIRGGSSPATRATRPPRRRARTGRTARWWRSGSTGWGRSSASRRRRTSGRRSAPRWPTGRRSRTPPTRSRSPCDRASGSASSRTATTTCSPRRRTSSASTSTRSSPRSRPVPTSRPRDGFRARVRAAGPPRASGSCTSRRARFHDHVTAKRLGLTTVWIDRRGGRSGTGATPEADAQPDATYPDMASFAAAATA